MQKRLLNDGGQDACNPGFSPPKLPSLVVLLLLLFQSFAGLSQANNELVNISGVVRDRAGSFLSQISVFVNGTSRGTITDAKGEFRLQATRFDSIAFSSVGYVSQLLPVSDNRVFYVILEATEGSLNDVVVVGFGRQRKISVVGAQSSINPEELKLPVANISTLLAGRISGGVGVQRSGQPGRNSADIWIRGISTFGGGSSSPLVLVDGVERSMNNIDPQDIASFTILKDAAGTAVYGVRGANGVVLVTTKTGKGGTPKIN